MIAPRPEEERAGIAPDHAVEPERVSIERRPAREIPGVSNPKESPPAQSSRAPRRRSAFVTTLTELNAIAALATTGLSRIPKVG